VILAAEGQRIRGSGTVHSGRESCCRFLEVSKEAASGYYEGEASFWGGSEGGTV
jgi:hypothetical protein